MPDDGISALNQYTVSVRLDKLVIEEKTPYGVHEFLLEMGGQLARRRLSVFLDIEILEVVG